MTLLSMLMVLVPAQAPSEWRCPVDLYADGYSCDCGCGIADPDCGPENDRARCNTNFCAPGWVPLLGSAGVCAPDVCGDGFVGKGTELCDDGEGPGCDETCSIVTEGYRCSGLGGGCRVMGCGDGYADLEAGERCDDGNEEPGDGCHECQPEPGFVCRRWFGCFPTTCGDMMIDYDWETQTGENCEDGNTEPGDGCGADCRAEPGWICDWAGCQRVVCGDGIVSRGEFGTGEQCDDRNTEDGDGCDSRCQIEPGWYCDDWSGCQRVICGDLVISWGEQCDDGNKEDGDGCSAQCMAEPGWACFWRPGACERVVCGDGRQMSDEAGTVVEMCDDGNKVGGDGCSEDCQIEPGFVCELTGCRPIVCGDGFIDRPGGGGWGPGPPKPEEPAAAEDKRMPPPDGGGGGVLQPLDEQCDDGNDRPGDGCDASCQIEDGWFCEAPGRPCVKPVCGDGEVEGPEQCDDGGLADGDGCSAECRREPGWVCLEPGAACERLPKAWVCSVVFFGGGDGCDCGCGARDPDCADDSLWSCDFNHCLEAAPWPTVEDPTVCGEVEPPPRPEPEPGPEVVDEPAVGDGDEAEAPGAEVVEAEPSAPRRDEGCGGGPGYPIGGAVWMGLLAIVSIFERLRRGRRLA